MITLLRILYVVALGLLLGGWVCGAEPVPGGKAVPSLEAVNGFRARNGLPPFTEDAGLTAAACRAAEHRAARLMFGHVTTGRGDFQFLDPGVHADSAGCAAYDMGTIRRFGGWLSCCARENYRYAGAGWALGPDGRVYCHLFVRR